MTCTYINSGVLIAARGEGAIAQRTLIILADRDRS